MTAHVDSRRSGLPASLASDLDGAFEAFVLSHQDGIYSGVRRLVPSAADPEDVTQETFIRAYKALQGYPTKRIRQIKLRPWLWTIALNLCRNAARGRARKPAPRPLATAPVVADSANTAAEAIGALEKQEWKVRLDSLTKPIRTAVVLRHVVDLSYAEIARIVDRPVGTVKADVHRGLVRLKNMLESETEEEV